jgi:hypothetical protein
MGEHSTTSAIRRAPTLHPKPPPITVRRCVTAGRDPTAEHRNRSPQRQHGR